MRLLVMVRHFAPSTRAVGVTTRRACLSLPPGTCHVLTADRSFDPDGIFEPAFTADLPVTRVTARLRGRCGDQPLARGLDYALAVVQAACRLHAEAPFDAVVVHYPCRFTLQAGLLVHELTRLPMVVHMHDYFAEVLHDIHPARILWWRMIDRAALHRAALVLVPTPRFARVYRRRGLRAVMVFPHLTTPTTDRPAVRDGGGPLDIVFTGMVYEAHEHAVRAFVSAVAGLDGVRVRFATPSEADYLRPVSIGSVSRSECLSMQAQADVLFLPLGIESPYPLEVESCLPSKLMDYLAAGKPVLAVVPPRSYVAELIESTGAGVAVTTADPAAIRAAVDRLRDPAARRQMAADALRACERFAPAVHGARLTAAIRRACSPSAAPRASRPEVVST